jgi:cytidylate kinase
VATARPRLAHSARSPWTGQGRRDERDIQRPFGGLAKAPDSIEVSTDGMMPEQVVDRLEEIVCGV